MEQHDFGAEAQLPAFFGGGSGGGADDALEGSPSYGASPNYSSSLDGPPEPFDGGSQDPGSTEELLLDPDAARRYLDVLEDTPADARDAREPSEMTVASKRPKWIPGEGMSAAEEKRCPSCRQMVGRAHFSNPHGSTRTDCASHAGKRHKHTFRHAIRNKADRKHRRSGTRQT